MSDAASAIVAQGTKVIVAFGGAAGTEIARVITDPLELQKSYQKVIDANKISWVDFDIEASDLADSASVSRRNLALSNIRKFNKCLKISITLPVGLSGLTSEGLKLLQDAKNKGLTFDVVNILAMVLIFLTCRILVAPILIWEMQSSIVRKQRWRNLKN